MISDFILFISSLISLRISCLRDSRSPLPPPAPVGGNEDAAVSWPVNEGCRLWKNPITCYMEVRLDLSTSFANYNAYLCIYQYTFIISKKQFPAY